MEETGKAGKKSNIEINADKGAKQNSHPGREEWPHLIRIGVMVFVTFAVSILFFFALYRFEGFAGIWSKLLAAAMPIIMGLVLAYLMNPVMLWLERCFKKLLSKKMKSESKLRKVSRALAITGSVIILVAIISLLIAAIVPSVIASISGLMKTLPNDVAAFINMIKNGNFGDSKIAELASTGLQNATDYIEDYATEKLIPEAQKYVAQITTGVISVVRGLFNFIIGIIVMVFPQPDSPTSPSVSPGFMANDTSSTAFNSIFLNPSCRLLLGKCLKRILLCGRFLCTILVCREY